MTKIAVLGAGSWGTTFAKVLVDAGSKVTLWSRRKPQAEEIHYDLSNTQYLPGIKLPLGLSATHSIAQAVETADYVFLAVPSQHLRAILRQLKPVLSNEAVVISLMKGLEKDTKLRMSQVIAQELKIPGNRIAVASGPNIAIEIAREEPTAAVVASSSKTTANRVAKLASNKYFHSIATTDVIGVELGGVLKNLVALAIGIADGVGYGDNTKAAIITNSLAENTALSIALGADPETMIGLAGLGDLIATCSSPVSRNFRSGKMLGQSMSLAEVVSSMDQVAEGLESIAPVLELAAEKKIKLAMVEQVWRIMQGELDPSEINPVTKLGGR